MDQNGGVGSVKYSPWFKLTNMVKLGINAHLCFLLVALCLMNTMLSFCENYPVALRAVELEN